MRRSYPAAPRMCKRINLRVTDEMIRVLAVFRGKRRGKLALYDQPSMSGILPRDPEWWQFLQAITVESEPKLVHKTETGFTEP